MPASVVHVDISEVSKALAVLGGFIVFYGLLSYVVKERLYLSEPLLAVTVGILVGPYVLNWVDPLSWGTEEETNYVTYQFTRIVVGIQVLFTGISLPKAYLWKEKISLTILLFGIMTTAWFTTALLMWGLIPGITYLESLAIAAAVTPTDPVLANSITTGRYAEKHVPANVRNIIVAESGANDGLGFPFLYLAIYLLARHGEDTGTSVGTEVGRWVYAVVIYQILLSIAFGSLVGFLARKTLKWAEGRSYIDKANFFAYGLGLAFFTLGTTGLFGSDDILACFIAGNSFTWDDWFRLRTEDNDFQEILDSVLNMAVFVYIGAIIPWAAFSDPVLNITGWRVVVLAILVLLLRRPPWVIAATKVIPALRDFKESTFAGWFGPIGVGAVFYIQVALRELPDDGTRTRLRNIYAPIVLLCVFASVLTHGVTIPISKLGPGVMRKTATLTKTKSITFSRPGSRTNTINVPVAGGVDGDSPPTTAAENSDGSVTGDSQTSSANGSHMRPSRGHVGFNEEGKALWNPLVAAAEWGVHVVAFWRPDSFWRKEVAHVHSEAHRHSNQASQVDKADISGPSQPTRRRSVEESDFASGLPSTEEDVTSASAASPDQPMVRSHLPPPSLELPVSQPTVPSSQDDSAAAAVSSQRSRRFSWLRAFDKELLDERSEARKEALRGWEKGEERERLRLDEIALRQMSLNAATGPTRVPSRPAETPSSAVDETPVQTDADNQNTSQSKTLRFV